VFPYWILFSVTAVGAVQYTFNRERALQGGPLLLAAGVLVAIMVGLRFQVGGDWDQYLGIFKRIGQMDFVEGLWDQDPGYSLLNWLGARFGFGMWFVNLICSILFSWGLTSFARRQPNPWLAILVSVPYLINVVAMGYTRQGVAIGFILAGLAVLDRGMVRFVIYLAFAVAFHKSSIVVLPLVALSASQRRVVTVGTALVSAVVLYYAFVQASVDRLMTNYVEAAYESQGAGIRVAMNIPPALIFLAMSRRFVAGEQERKLWRNFSLAAIVALLLLQFTSATTAVDRLALYIIPLQLMVLSRTPVVFGREGRSMGLTLLIILYSAAIQFVWLNYAANAQAWLPYRFYPTAEGDAARDSQ
jgi:hypothetical protein